MKFYNIDRFLLKEVFQNSKTNYQLKKQQQVKQSYFMRKMQPFNQ